MTTFGGMYSVRGYKESGIIADGGILASVQYEYDLISADRAKYGSDLSGAEAKPFVRKLAPLAFMDFGRARIKDRLVGENNEELLSIGAGGLIELGDHFAGAVYYGFPLKGTSTTDTEDGALNLSLMMRW
jgi:hemolysin activation/secretion protein